MSQTSFTLDDSQIAAIGDWSKGDEYELKMKVRMTGKHDTEGGVSGDFEVLDVTVYDEPEESSGEEEEEED